MKLATMAAGLVGVQLTASLFVPETFLLLNSLLFLVAIHGCLNYSVQVTTWREGGISFAAFGMVHTITLILALVFSILSGGGWFFFASVFCYVAYRGNERILFNLQITRGHITRAYGIILLGLVIEIAVALALYAFRGAMADRFLLPSLSVLLVTIPLTLSLLYRGRPDIFRALLADKKGMLLMSAHSGLIALNVMSDRLVFSTGISSIHGYFADYLLIFSYCSAAYALTISLLEIQRPALFKITSVSLREFLIRGDFGKFVAIALGTTILSGGTIYCGVAIFPGAAGIAVGAPTLLFTGFLSFFFLGQAILSFLHVYCLSEKLYGLLFGSWAVSAAVRLLGYSQSEWAEFLPITAFSGFAAIAAVFLLSKKRAS
jgi:hypothetical protein